jgi:hypothetical protein
MKHVIRFLFYVLVALLLLSIDKKLENIQTLLFTQTETMLQQSQPPPPPVPSSLTVA